MPFDNPASARPYMREGTAALAALVQSQPSRDVLHLIAAELQHRDRKAARMLAEQVAAMLSVGPIQPQPVAQPVAVDPRDTLAALPPAIPPAEMMRAKPAKRATSKRADKRPGDVGWKPPSLETLIKRVGYPSMMWPPGLMLHNPMREARIAGLRLAGWTEGETVDGYTTWYMGEARLRMGVHGALYLGDDTWIHLAREERDRLTDAGRASLEERAKQAGRKARREDARAKLSGARKVALEYCRKWRSMQKTDQAKWYPVEGRKAALHRAWAARKSLRAEMAG